MPETRSPEDIISKSNEILGNNGEKTVEISHDVKIEIIRDTIRSLIIDILEEECELMPDISDIEEELAGDPNINIIKEPLINSKNML